jgi:hypothetical protein
LIVWILDSIIQEASVADLQDAVPQAPEARRDRSAGARREARLKRASREKRIIALLNSGMSVAELAAGERVTLRRMQILVRDILARRAPHPPAEYLALQVNRLNEAMIVSYAAMACGNLKAVDRVVRIVSEMDRYHGFAASQISPPAAQRRLALRRIGRRSLWRRRTAHGPMEKAPQATERARYGDGNGDYIVDTTYRDM